MAISRASVQGGPRAKGNSGADSMGRLIQNFQQLNQSQQELDRLQRNQNAKRLAPMLEQQINRAGGVRNFLQSSEGRESLQYYLTASTNKTDEEIGNIVAAWQGLPATEAETLKMLQTSAAGGDKQAMDFLNKFYNGMSIAGSQLRRGQGAPALGQLQQALQETEKKIAGLAPPEKPQGAPSGGEAPSGPRGQTRGPGAGETPSGGGEVPGETSASNEPTPFSTALGSGEVFDMGKYLQEKGKYLQGKVEDIGEYFQEKREKYQGEDIVTKETMAPYEQGYLSNTPPSEERPTEREEANAADREELSKELEKRGTLSTDAIRKIYPGASSLSKDELNRRYPEISNLPKDLREKIYSAREEARQEKIKAADTAREKALAREESLPTGEVTEQNRTMNTMAGVGPGASSGLRGAEPEPEPGPSPGDFGSRSREILSDQEAGESPPAEAKKQLTETIESSETKAIVESAGDNPKGMVDLTQYKKDLAKYKTRKGELMAKKKRLQKALAAVDSGGDPMANSMFKDLYAGRKVSDARYSTGLSRASKALWGKEERDRLIGWMNNMISTGAIENATYRRRLDPQAAAEADKVLANMAAMEELDLKRDRLELQKDQWAVQKVLKELQADLLTKEAEAAKGAGFDPELYKIILSEVSDVHQKLIDKGYNEKEIDEFFRKNPSLGVLSKALEELTGAITGIEAQKSQVRLGILGRIKSIFGGEPPQGYTYGAAPISGGMPGGGGVNSPNVRDEFGLTQ